MEDVEKPLKFCHTGLAPAPAPALAPATETSPVPAPAPAHAHAPDLAPAPSAPSSTSPSTADTSVLLLHQPLYITQSTVKQPKEKPCPEEIMEILPPLCLSSRYKTQAYFPCFFF